MKNILHFKEFNENYSFLESFNPRLESMYYDLKNESSIDESLSSIDKGIINKYKTKDGNWDYNKLENCTNELDFYILFKYSSKKSFWISQQAMEAVLEALFMAMAKKSSMWNVPIPGRKTIQVPIFDAVAIRLAKDSTQSDRHFAHNPLKFCWAMNRNTKYHKIPINTSLKSIKSLLWPELANLTTDAAVYDIWISPETGKLQRHGKPKNFFDFPDDVPIKYQPF